MISISISYNIAVEILCFQLQHFGLTTKREDGLKYFPTQTTQPLEVIHPVFPLQQLNIILLPLIFKNYGNTQKDKQLGARLPLLHPILLACR